MLPYLKAITFALCLLSLPLLLAAQQINSTASYARFNVSKLGFSNVSGVFKGMEGKAVFDPDDMSKNSFNVCIKAATVSTGEPDRDEHLRAKDFFHAKKYPNICFNSQSMLRTKTGYLVTGIVKIKATSKLVNIPFTNENKTLKGRLKLNRKDFDLNDGTGMFVIGETVDIEIVCTLH